MGVPGNIKVASIFSGSSRSVLQWPLVRTPHWRGTRVGGAMTRSCRVAWVAPPNQLRSCSCRQPQMRRGSRCLRHAGLAVHHDLASCMLPATCRLAVDRYEIYLVTAVTFYRVPVLHARNLRLALPATLHPSHFPREIHFWLNNAGLVR